MQEKKAKRISSGRIRSFRQSDLARRADGISMGKEQTVLKIKGDKSDTDVIKGIGTAGVKKGLSLRWKIISAALVIVLVTTLLIFFVVYSKVSNQLNTEINNKGVTILSILESLDPSYWLLAMQEKEKGPTTRINAIEEFIESVCDSASLTREIYLDGFKRIVDQQDKSIERIRKGLPPNELYLLDELLSSIFAGRWSSIKDQLTRDTELSSGYKKLTDFIVLPLGSIDPFSNIRTESGYKDVLDISVLDKKDNRSISLAAKARNFKVGSKLGSIEDASIIDGSIIGEDIPARNFIKERQLEDRTLQFTVLLSLTDIKNAQNQLLYSIFLPVIMAIIIGSAISIALSYLITNPLNYLINDIELVSRGNLNHETVPRSNDEIGLVASTFDRMTKLIKIAHEQEIERRTLEHELNIASQIQSNLLPKRKPQADGYDIEAFYKPSKEVGGDYYDFIEIDNNHMGMIVADVSGKGVPASIVMSMVRAFVRMEAERSKNTSAKDTLIRVNNVLTKDMKKGMFVTAFYMIMNYRTHELLVSSAGHNPLILWRAHDNLLELINPNGIALGFNAGELFERSMKEEKIILEPGDRVLVYTDGVVEAKNEKNEFFTDKRLNVLMQKIASKSSKEVIEILTQTLENYKGNAPQHDDITLLTLKRIK